MMFNGSHAGRLVHPVVRVAVLLLLLVTQTPLLPALLLGTAMFDDGHRVECSASGGVLHVHLKHGAAAGIWPGLAAPGHAHGVWLRILVPVGPRHEDHRFDFAPPAMARGENEVLCATAEPVGGESGFVWLPEFMVAGELSAAGRRGTWPAVACHDPPPEPGDLSSLVLRV